MAKARILRSDKSDEGYRVHNGYLTAPATGPTLDSLRRRQRDDEYEDEEDPDDIVEVHNYIIPSNEEADYQTGDNEEQSGPDEEVARYPENEYTVLTEDNHHVVYRTSGGEANRAPNSRTDRFDMGTARDGGYSQSRPPRTLAELNAFHVGHYARRGTGR